MFINLAEMTRAADEVHRLVGELNAWIEGAARLGVSIEVSQQPRLRESPLGHRNAPAILITTTVPSP